MATAVAQIVQADPPSRTRWSIKCTGVACFIKDNPMRTYYIRVYDIKVICLKMFKIPVENDRI